MSRYTDADVRLVAEAVCDIDLAHRALAALADAGRLTPADAEQQRVMVVKTWYRSLQADGQVWCESGDAREVVALSEGIAAKFERLVITEVMGVWEPWVA